MIDQLPKRIQDRQVDALPQVDGLPLMTDEVVRGLQLILDSASMELGEKLELQVDLDDLPSLTAAVNWLASVVGSAQLSE